MRDERIRDKRWQRVRDMCYRRDRASDARCWICGGRIDYRATPGEPDAWEPDHVLTVADHPECQLDPGNILPAHCSCNRARGARDARDRQRGESLGTRSRAWL